MLYPGIDFLQVLILEIRRVLPSASSKQRTETVKTPHNGFQRKTTVMDYRLPWKWGNTLIEQTESVQIQAILMERERKYTFSPSLPPSSLLSFLSPFPYRITSNPYNKQWVAHSAFYKWGKFLSFLLESYSLWWSSWDWNLGQIGVWCTTTGCSQLPTSPFFSPMYIPRVWHPQDYKIPLDHLIVFLEML